jgi:hypothetical protein
MYIIAGILERELRYIAGDVVHFRAGIDTNLNSSPTTVIHPGLRFI